MPRHSRATTVYPIAMRYLEVLRVADLTPGLRRVTFTGDELGAFTTADGITLPEFVTSGFDDDVHLVFSYPGETEPVLPILREDGGITIPKDPRPLWRVYTVRRYDPVARELDVEFVKHGVGVATTWAYRAKRGDRLHVAGPASSLGLPKNADWMLVVGDDAALPAISRLLEDLPSDGRAQVFIDIADDSHRLNLVKPPGAELTWLSRKGGAPGNSAALLDTLREATVPDGNCYAWIAGEQSVVRDVRRYLVEERGLPKTQIHFTGYWRRGEVVSLEGDPEVPDPQQNEEAMEKLHEQSELLPPLAIRLASNLGIADLISRGVTSVSAIADETKTDPRALAKFLRYLQAIELLEPTDGGYALTETGECLTVDWVARILDKDGVSARKEQAFLGLEHVLRAGISDYASEYAVLRKETWFAEKLYDDASEDADYEAVPIAEAGDLVTAGHVVVHSDTAGAIAAALVERNPSVQVTIAALPSFAAWLRNDLVSSIPDAAQRGRVEIVEQSVFEQSPSADRIVLANALAEHPDADAALILRKAIAGVVPSGRLLIAEDTFDTTDLDEHDAENDLLNLALFGSGLRTAEELDALIASAGLKIESIEPLSWGRVLRTVVPA